MVTETADEKARRLALLKNVEAKAVDKTFHRAQLEVLRAKQEVLFEKDRRQREAWERRADLISTYIALACRLAFFAAIFIAAVAVAWHFL